MATRLHRPAGSAADGLWSVSLDPERAGWSWTGLRILDLPAGEKFAFATGSDEVLVLPLSGSCVVECDGETIRLDGRSGVFDGTTDFAYAPSGTVVNVASTDGGRFAVPAARASKRLPFRRGAAGDVTIEARGAGNCSRVIRGYCMPGSFDADRLMVCEVVTPSGNWSSYPPHKHDEESETESRLEEIYYFEVEDGPTSPGIAYQRAAAVLAEVRTGDVVLVPDGFHGPSMAVPGYDLYYLNVMAGPGERAWRICEDPEHVWIRQTWRDQPVDPRVLAAVPTGRPS